MDDSCQPVQNHNHDLLLLQCWAVEVEQTKSIKHGGDSMNSSKNIRSCKRLAGIAALSGALIMTCSLAAFGQQEVDPTWYNPWPGPNTAVAQSAPQAAVQQHAKIKSVTASKRIAKSSGKRSSTRSSTRTKA
jgi:hypothetical protein